MILNWKNISQIKMSVGTRPQIVSDALDDQSKALDTARMQNLTLKQLLLQQPSNQRPCPDLASLLKVRLFTSKFLIVGVLMCVNYLLLLNTWAKVHTFSRGVTLILKTLYFFQSFSSLNSMCNCFLTNVKRYPGISLCANFSATIRYTPSQGVLLCNKFLYNNKVQTFWRGVTLQQISAQQ